MSITNPTPGEFLALKAQTYTGKDFRPGVSAQCMNFVRHVLDDLSYPLADMVTAKPLDGHWTGPELASSLAGKDLGTAITDLTQVQPGDIVFFNDTYETGFPPGTITHVAIANSPNSFTHRPTKSRPVERGLFSGFWLDRFRCVIRPTPKLLIASTPPATDPEPARKAWKVYLGDEHGSKLIDTVPIDLVSGRAIMTAQVLAAVGGHGLVINNTDKAIRFVPPGN